MLLGRDDAQATVDRLLAGARAGRSGARVVRGEPGIGKTAILDAAAEAATDFRILRAIGVEAESELGFAALHELCRPAVDAIDRLPAGQARALRSAFAIDAAAVVDRFAVYAATLGLLAEVAEAGPLLALVDDAHWRPKAADQRRPAIRAIATWDVSSGAGMRNRRRRPGRP